MVSKTIRNFGALADLWPLALMAVLAGALVVGMFTADGVSATTARAQDPAASQLASPRLPPGATPQAPG